MIIVCKAYGETYSVTTFVEDENDIVVVAEKFARKLQEIMEIDSKDVIQKIEFETIDVDSAKYLYYDELIDKEDTERYIYEDEEIKLLN